MHRAQLLLKRRSVFVYCAASPVCNLSAGDEDPQSLHPLPKHCTRLGLAMVRVGRWKEDSVIAVSTRSQRENERKREKKGKGTRQTAEGAQGKLYGGQDSVPTSVMRLQRWVSSLYREPFCLGTDCVGVGIGQLVGTVSPSPSRGHTHRGRVQCLVMTKVFIC